MAEDINLSNYKKGVFTIPWETKEGGFNSEKGDKRGE